MRGIGLINFFFLLKYQGETHFGLGFPSFIPYGNIGFSQDYSKQFYCNIGFTFSCATFMR